MSDSPAPAAAAAPAKKKGGKLILVVVCLLFIGAGAAFPMVVDVPALMGKGKHGEKEKKPADTKTAIVPFGEVVVNLSEERNARYLKIKIAVTVEADAEKEMTDLLKKYQPALKSKVIGHLAGKSLKDVSGSVGFNRTQRELLEKFEDVLFPDGNSRIRAVLFEEYVIQ